MTGKSHVAFTKSGMLKTVSLRTETDSLSVPVLAAHEMVFAVQSGRFVPPSVVAGRHTPESWAAVVPDLVFDLHLDADDWRFISTAYLFAGGLPGTDAYDSCAHQLFLARLSSNSFLKGLYGYD